MNCVIIVGFGAVAFYFTACMGGPLWGCMLAFLVGEFLGFGLIRVLEGERRGK